MDADLIAELKGEIRDIQERLRAIEVEQRKIKEDILSGEPKARMQKRLLHRNDDNINDLRKKIDEEIRVEI